jgi:hypothetical protein
MSDAKAAAAARRAKILARDKSRLDIAKGLKVYTSTINTNNNNINNINNTNNTTTIRMH